MLHQLFRWLLVPLGAEMFGMEEVLQILENERLQRTFAASRNKLGSADKPAHRCFRRWMLSWSKIGSNNPRLK